MIRLVIFLAVLLSGLSCKKSSYKPQGNGLVEIYGLESYHFVPNKCQVDPSSAVLKVIPVITNSQIISYSKGDYEFRLTNPGKEAAKAFKDIFVFAVTVNKEVIYYGIYKPFTSSSSCDHSITMNISYPNSNLSMRLGYPSPMPGITIDDQRNNPKLLAALEAQGKLAP